jgi:hypothetical protein
MNRRKSQTLEKTFVHRADFLWIERLTANIDVATILGSIPASSDTVESEGCQMMHC